MIDMEDPDVATESFVTPSAIEKSPLDFDNENPTPLMTEGNGTEDQAHETVAPEIPPRNMHATRVALESTHRGKTLPTMGLAADSTFVTPADTKGTSDPDPLSYAEPQPHPEQSMTQPFEIPTENMATMEVQDTHYAESAGLGNRPPPYPWLGHPEEVQDLQNQTSNLKTLLEAEANMKKVAEAKNAELTKELESLCTQFSDLQVSNDQLTQQVSTLQTQIIGEERIKASFEEFKKYEDDMVEKHCAEMDARMDALSINFDEELYPHMLTAIASMSEGLTHGIEHGKAGRDLEVVEAYDPEANSKYVQALQELKDLNDSGEDAPNWIRDLRPSTSQLKIHVYPEARDPRNPWAVKEEMLLEEAIAANVSRTKKKKRCRVVCRTHGVDSVHHARSDDVPVSVPTVASQSLTILLADAATQTETSEDDVSLRLLRSKSLSPMYNLDCP
uniref:Transposase (Putative), gypsy type n=1 Tax=Tanacetum cinerariifolium TaxID=118510 RepID=A0A6L2N4T6_TANCI|nr:hypothetical protein [Tanacetum cinerariifolium]